MSIALLRTNNKYCLSQYPKKVGWLYNPNYGGALTPGERRYHGVWWVSETNLSHFYWNCPWTAEKADRLGYNSIFYFGKVRRVRGVRHSDSCIHHSH